VPWTLVATFDDDSISASEMKRPGLDQLTAVTKDAEVDVMLTWDRNRLVQPKKEFGGFLLERKLQESGKRAMYAATRRETDRSFASGLISYVEHYLNREHETVNRAEDERTVLTCGKLPLT
jgi:hypothetical protein